MKESHSARFS